jgi:hypothetical protein
MRLIVAILATFSLSDILSIGARERHCCGSWSTLRAPSSSGESAEAKLFQGGKQMATVTLGYWLAAVSGVTTDAVI